MKVIIVEDEISASENLTYLLNSIDKNIEVITVLDSVKSSVKYFSSPNEADLILMDIHLADGISFEIFDQVTINIPVIFTTAYDHYAIKAFEVNSIDYLLKPIDKGTLETALEKYTTRNNPSNKVAPYGDLFKLISEQKKKFKSRFLIKAGQKIKAVSVEKVAYFYSQNKLTYLITHDKQRLPLDLTLENLEVQLDPDSFYRANRQFIVGFESIAELHPYFKGRIKVELNPPSELELVVSSEKTREFKAWLDK